MTASRRACFELVQHVLDAHGLVTLGLDQALGDVEERVPAD